MRTDTIILIATLAVPAGYAQQVTQEPLPQRQGHEFVIEDWNGKATRNDFGFNHFGGNQGTVDVPVAGITTLALADDRVAGAKGRALSLAVNFDGVGNDGLGGIFVSLNGLTDTLVSLDGTTPTKTRFPGYSADFDDFFRSFQPWAGRTIEGLSFHARLAPGSAPLRVKVELKDEADRDVFVRVLIKSENWGVASLPRALFSQSVSGDPAAFDWHRVSQCGLLVEKFVSGEVSNPSGGFEIDDLRLDDTDGFYADLNAAANPDGTLQARYRDAFLDLVSRLSMLYFRDFSSTDPRTGGLICDRSSFADLATVGGVPFQLTAWIAAAERGAISHAEARARTVALLRVLAGAPQGPERLGRIGHRGFFYHFLGIDGRRKINFDFPETPAVNEAMNTVELSLIDTALAAAGVTIAREFWLGGDAEEAEIRNLADTILGRIDWPFMVHTLADGKKQFALGWKPNETRDDSGPYGRFALPDADGLGHFSSKMINGVEVPATLDYMTSEGLLAALLAMASPNPAYRLGPEVWNDMIRQGSPFVKSWPGSLFTYTWFNQFVDTKRLGPDNHPSRPVDWYANTAAAITAVRNAAANNTTGMVSLGAGFSGVDPCEGPFDLYSANAFAAAAIADTPPGWLNFECENATGDGDWVWQGSASGLKTRRLETPGAFSTPFNLPAAIPLRAVVRYSNDGDQDSLTVRADTQNLGTFTTVSTGGGGSGWNIFTVSPLLGPTPVAAGAHTLELEVNTTDFYGVEPDLIKLYGPLESGAFTAYGVAEQLPWVNMDAVNELFRLARFDLYGDGRPPLFHLRLGMADAFHLEIAEGLTGHGLTGSESFVIRNKGPWSNQTGFAIDHGPTTMSLTNSLVRGLFQSLFTKNAGVSTALAALFPAAKSPFAQWTLDHFGSTTAPDAAPDADPDRDGACNLIEYATGGDPRGPSVIQVAVSRQGGEVLLSLPVDLAAVVNLVPEISHNLIQWTPLAAAARRVGQVGEGIVTMEWRVPSDAASSFFRLHVSASQ